MGFSRDEIQEALANNRYDEVMATYLLLDEKRQKLTVRFTLHNDKFLIARWSSLTLSCPRVSPLMSKIVWRETE